MRQNFDEKSSGLRFKLSQRLDFATSANSATRFGKMSPLWQNYAHLLVKFEGLFNIWQNVDPTLVTFFVQKRFKRERELVWVQLAERSLPHQRASVRI